MTTYPTSHLPEEHQDKVHGPMKDIGSKADELMAIISETDMRVFGFVHHGIRVNIYKEPEYHADLTGG